MRSIGPTAAGILPIIISAPLNSIYLAATQLCLTEEDHSVLTLELCQTLSAMTHWAPYTQYQLTKLRDHLAKGADVWLLTKNPSDWAQVVLAEPENNPRLRTDGLRSEAEISGSLPEGAPSGPITAHLRLAKDCEFADGELPYPLQHFVGYTLSEPAGHPEGSADPSNASPLVYALGVLILVSAVQRVSYRACEFIAQTTSVSPVASPLGG